MKKGLYFKWVYGSYNQKFKQVGLHPDGTLWNPNGHPEEEIRKILDRVLLERAENRKKAAAKAAITRQRRHELKVQQIIKAIIAKQKIGPRNSCACCGKQLTDEESIGRGIGSECWANILRRIERSESERLNPTLTSN